MALPWTVEGLMGKLFEGKLGLTPGRFGIGRGWLPENTHNPWYLVEQTDPEGHFEQGFPTLYIGVRMKLPALP